jgi:tRNA A-37 threonylcarbamoyl transferase component Bud32
MMRATEAAGLVDQHEVHPHAVHGAVHELAYFDLVAAACRDDVARARGWPAEPTMDAGKTWIRVTNARSSSRAQGWKLHVSASVWSAAGVLRRVLPVLMDETASFKVAATTRTLAQLNLGQAGMSQVAKFITIYPDDDAQAVRLAVALHHATRDLRGPRILSDRQVAPGSLVHYRYGGFVGRYVQLPAGELLPAITAPGGELIPDRRLTRFAPPEWVVDPFVEAGVTTSSCEALHVPGNRYRVLSLLHRSPRGEVYLGIDLVGARRCVLKRARAHASQDEQGRDARDRLRYEARLLERLAGSPAIAAMYDLVEDEREDDVWLAMEDVEGVSLDRHLTLGYAAGSPFDAVTVIGWARQLTAALGAMHQAGLVYRDLKPSNLILAPDGYLRLIDFEMTHDARSTAPVFGLGTPGYMSPQQREHQPPSPADDVYALGAVMYFAATGADPSGTPAWGALLDRPVSLLCPGVPAGLAEVIGRCLEPSPAARFPGMQAVDEALASLGSTASGVAPGLGMEPNDTSEQTARRAAKGIARRLGDTICATAQQPPHGQGLTWVNDHHAGLPIPYRTIDVGAAGILLGLGELVVELGDPRHRVALERAADWLVSAEPADGLPNAGLYVGEAGVGAALLHAGQILHKPELVAAAVERGRAIARIPYASPDLYNGAAGRLLFHLMLWDATAEAEHLEVATSIGDWLVESAERVADDEVRWRFPTGFGGFSNQAFTGYAHGAAGIAHVLLELSAATGQPRFRGPARSAARWLVRIARPTLADGSGLDWPAYEGGTSRGGLWCHGATGIGRFFLHAAEAELVAEAREVAVRAARMAARGTRWAAPVQCHGLAGTIEFLLDMYRATRDAAYLAEARSHARLLQTFAAERDGNLVFSSDAPNEHTPSYMLGYAGVAACFLRLAAPERLPHALSRAGFRRHARSASGIQRGSR